MSDVHFGTVEPEIVERVVESVNVLSPDVVVVSGDLTQRARTREFKAAREFLDRLPQPQIVVPGNHDIPMFNVYHRFFKKLDKYQRYITEDLTPSFVDDELAVVGVNTARSLVVKAGRINQEQVGFIRSLFCDLDEKMLKVVVTHHPFDLPENSYHKDVVGRADMAMPLISDCGGNVFMAGHLHVAHTDTTAKRYKLENGRNTLVIQAGTATSARVRGEARSYNVIEFEHPSLSIRRYECVDVSEGFLPSEEKRYVQSPTGWDKVTTE